MKFKDLNYHCLKLGGGLDELGSLLEPAEIVHGHDEVGTRRRQDLMSVDLQNSLLRLQAMKQPPC